MADTGIRLVIMGRGAWQKLAEPEAFEDLMLITAADTILLWAIIISAAFVLFALSLSFYLLFDHLSGYNEPDEQKWLIGIILMVPVYTITAPKIAIYFDIAGNCYEAFALYAFGRYLIACLGGEEMAVQKLAKQGAVGPHEPLLDKETEPHEVVHPIPLKWCLNPWELGAPFYDTTKFGIVQYMIIKVGCSWVAFILNLFGWYGEGDFDFTQGYPYVTILQNFSQMWALYCLVQFYYVTKHTLHEINPLAKFLCFKAVVFVTWWQGVGIALLFATGLATKWLPFYVSDEKADMLQTNLQNFLICIEMAIAAVAHIYVYPATPYRRGPRQNLNKIDSVAGELEEDIEVTATSVKESMKDVVMGGGEHVVEDVKVTVAQAVEPVESGFTNLNETLQDNVSKMNDKLQDNVSKLNENFHEKVHNWQGRHTEEISKEGTYRVNRDKEDDESDEIVQTQERVVTERNDEHPETSEGSSGVIKEEIEGTATSHSTDETRQGEETINFRQQMERTGSAERKETSSTTKETADDGKIKKNESMSVSEKYRLDSKGDLASKELKGHKVEMNMDGDIVSDVITEEREERDETGELVKTDVKATPVDKSGRGR